MQTTRFYGAVLSHPQRRQNALASKQVQLAPLPDVVRFGVQDTDGLTGRAAELAKAKLGERRRGDYPQVISCPNIDLIKPNWRGKNKKLKMELTGLLKDMNNSLGAGDITTFNSAKKELYEKLWRFNVEKQELMDGVSASYDSSPGFKNALGFPQGLIETRPRQVRNSNTGEIELKSRAWDKLVFVLSDSEALARKNLAGIDLSHVALRTPSMLQANAAKIGDELNYSRVSLAESNLRDANLRKADLQGADLSEANLFRADLRISDLSDTRMDFTVLTQARLDQTDMTKCTVVGNFILPDDAVFSEKTPIGGYPRVINPPAKEARNGFTSEELASGDPMFTPYRRWDEENEMTLQADAEIAEAPEYPGSYGAS